MDFMILEEIMNSKIIAMMNKNHHQAPTMRYFIG